MSSPVKLDGTEFALQGCPVNRFVCMGQQRGNRGITHTVFLNREPIHPHFFVGEPSALSGYCSYRFLYNNNVSVRVGVVFASMASRTQSSDNTLSVVNSVTDLPDDFEPSFILEKSAGILLFKASDASLLVIPSDVESHLLVKTA